MQEEIPGVERKLIRVWRNGFPPLPTFESPTVSTVDVFEKTGQLRSSTLKKRTTRNSLKWHHVASTPNICNTDICNSRSEDVCNNGISKEICSNDFCKNKDCNADICRDKDICNTDICKDKDICNKWEPGDLNLVVSRGRKLPPLDWKVFWNYKRWWTSR